MRSRKNTKKILTILVALILFITVAYAALSTTLTITTNQVTQSAFTWNVAFNGSSASGTSSGTSTTGLSCGTATITATTVTVGNTTISKPDDKCTYTLTVKNTGSIDAVLNTIQYKKAGSSSYSSGSTFTDGNLTYGLYTDNTGTTALSTGGTLAKTSGSLTIYLVIKYSGTSLNSSAVTQSGASFQLIYNQK